MAIGSTTGETAVRRLSALAQDSRLEVFRQLVQAGEPLAAGEIGQRVGVPASTLSSHLNVLANADLVKRRRRSRSILYEANYEAMHELIAFLLEDCCQGRAEVCSPLMEVISRASCCAPTIGVNA